MCCENVYTYACGHPCFAQRDWSTCSALKWPNQPVEMVPDLPERCPEFNRVEHKVRSVCGKCRVAAIKAASAKSLELETTAGPKKKPKQSADKGADIGSNQTQKKQKPSAIKSAKRKADTDGPEDSQSRKESKGKDAEKAPLKIKLKWTDDAELAPAAENAETSPDPGKPLSPTSDPNFVASSDGDTSSSGDDLSDPDDPHWWVDDPHRYCTRVRHQRRINGQMVDIDVAEAERLEKSQPPTPRVWSRHEPSSSTYQDPEKLHRARTIEEGREVERAKREQQKARKQAREQREREKEIGKLVEEQIAGKKPIQVRFDMNDGIHLPNEGAIETCSSPFNDSGVELSSDDWRRASLDPLLKASQQVPQVQRAESVSSIESEEL